MTGIALETMLEGGLFDTWRGLPLHPLIVHAVVVLLPLAALALIAEVLVPRWAKKYSTMTLGLLLVGTLAANAAKESGTALATHLGRPATHARWGSVLPFVAAGLFVVAAVWWFLRRDAQRAPGARKGFALVTVLLAIATLGLTVLVGDTGATAVWSGRIVRPTAPSVAATSDATASPSPTTTDSASSAAPSDTPVSAPASTPTSASASATAYTMAEVKKHNSESSCWAAIDAKVYDLTAWINQHPGGPSHILALCGTDATQAFQAQHAGDPEPAAELKQFLLGPMS